MNSTNEICSKCEYHEIMAKVYDIHIYSNDCDRYLKDICKAKFTTKNKCVGCEKNETTY